MPLGISQWRATSSSVCVCILSNVIAKISVQACERIVFQRGCESEKCARVFVGDLTLKGNGNLIRLMRHDRDR